MSLMKTTLKGLIAIALSLPAISFAMEDFLTITNATKLDSTSKSNGLFCSTKLGNIGITRAGTTNYVQRRLVFLACANNPTNCQTEVYLTTNCSGPSIATVIMDARNVPEAVGLKSFTMHDSHYNIEGAGFTIAIKEVA